ncbi:PREDICTED: uncharacterized protein LOC104819927 [Tarenaya hassleriana]|uniref:uncharacterized protein LOC104819927 n=1 Tax=Tarenaya hassleriana TaxID=28532 RepID=UPI00053C6756|nr:PREDICTED: uncharacterized protein LOC104819927 [Tarenaya hassleriana]
MRILRARLVKGRMPSLYPSPQSRGWCSSKGNRGEVEEIPTKRLEAIEEEMREMRRDMSTMKSKLGEISKANQDLVEFKDQVKRQEGKEEGRTMFLTKRERKKFAYYAKVSMLACHFQLMISLI